METVLGAWRSRFLASMAVVAAAWLLAACSAGGGEGDAGALLASVGGTGCAPNEKCVAPARPSAPGETVEIAAVEVVQKGFTLTAAGQQRQLSARVYDKRGMVVDVPVQWSSSRPGVLAVDSAGMATAGGSTGLAQVVAETAGVRSAPVVALVAQVAPGALLVTDEDVVGDPVDADPLGSGPTDRYAITLRGGAAPSLGAIVVGIGSKPVGGKVVAVETFGGQHRVTLQVVPLRTMFPNLAFDERIDLSTAAFDLRPGEAADYQITRQGSRLVFTPRTPVAKRLLRASNRTLEKMFSFQSRDPFEDDADPEDDSEPNPFEVTRNWGRLYCKVTAPDPGKMSDLVKIEAPPTFNFDAPLQLQLAHSAELGWERILVSGSVEAGLKFGLEFDLGIEAAVECRIGLPEWRLPLPGAIGLLLGGVMKLNVGAKFEPRISLATLDLTLDLGAKQSGIELGVACVPLTGCRLVSELGSVQPVFEFEPKLPSADFRVELPMQGFVMGVMKFGATISDRLRLRLATVTFGPKFEGDFAPVDTQAGNSDYESDYKLTLPLEIEIPPPRILNKIAERLGMQELTAVAVTPVNVELGTSPKGTVTVNPPLFAAGDTVDVRVDLDSASVWKILGLGYNVSKLAVLLYQNRFPREVAAEVPREGQTRFEFSFVAPVAGRADEVFAFASMNLPPVFKVEIGNGSKVSVRGAGGTGTLGDPTDGNPLGALITSQTFFLLKVRDSVDQPPSAPVALEIKGPPGWNGGEKFTVTYPAGRPWLAIGVPVAPVTGTYEVSGEIDDKEVSDSFEVDASSRLVPASGLRLEEAGLTAYRASFVAPVQARSAASFLREGSVEVTDRAYAPVTPGQTSMIDVSGFQTEPQRRLSAIVNLYTADLSDPNVTDWPGQFNFSTNAHSYPTISMSRVTVPGQVPTDIYFALSPLYLANGCETCTPRNAPIQIEWSWSPCISNGEDCGGALYPAPNGLSARFVAFRPGTFTITARWQQFPEFSVGITVNAVPAPPP